MNECLDGSHDCNKSITFCVNTFGSYSCFCNHGFTGSGKNNCTGEMFVFFVYDFIPSLGCAEAPLLQILTSARMGKITVMLHRRHAVISLGISVASVFQVSWEMAPFALVCFQLPTLSALFDCSCNSTCCQEKKNFFRCK